MKLIVGLGNPGRKYAGTRHNIGFYVVARVAEQYAQGSIRNRFHAEVIEVRIGSAGALIACPNTYMNRSGLSVREAKDYYKLDLSDILVVCDDMNLPLGRIRLRPSGSSGGQKGLQNIIQCLGTDQFSRLRVGIGRPPESWDAVDYVLAKFTSSERPLVEQVVDRAAHAIEDWVHRGIDYCMNHYNADALGPASTNE